MINPVLNIADAELSDFGNGKSFADNLDYWDGEDTE